MKKDDLYLKVFINKSEFKDENGEIHVFHEGKSSDAAKKRNKKITDRLRTGFLEKQIETIKTNPDLSKLNLAENQQTYISKLVDSITSEVGRAIVGLTILQLVIKTIAPEQSIRLHKGSVQGNQFSWKEGVSMRVLDKKFITPVLRKYDLLKLNADGFMMTRSLAENYPYSLAYKAKVRGARDEWLHLIEDLESNKLDPKNALIFMLSQLINKAEDFLTLRKSTLQKVESFISKNYKLKLKDTLDLILKHITESEHSARLMEIGMHSLLQSLDDLDLIQEDLMPLSQMRSANKKHGNIGDIELSIKGIIIESWDAKYGKSYLKDELDELTDKLKMQSTRPKIAGFVTINKPDLKKDIKEKIKKIHATYKVKTLILPFEEWVKQMVEHSSITIDESILAKSWLRAYTESLAQLRRNIAPIDEPCFIWVKKLETLVSQ